MERTTPRQEKARSRISMLAGTGAGLSTAGWLWVYKKVAIADSGGRTRVGTTVGWGLG